MLVTDLEDKEGKVTISYEYTRPSPGGPFNGRFRSNANLLKGETFYWLFGQAVVTRISKVKKDKP